MKTQVDQLHEIKKSPERDSSRDKYISHDKGGYFQLVGKRWVIQELCWDNYSIIKEKYNLDSNLKPHIKISSTPWLVWPSGLSTGLWTKGLLVQFPSGYMPGLWARSPIGGAQEATTHRCFSPFLSPSLPLYLKTNKQTNKYFKSSRWIKD